jgi:hypothetical protein
MPKTPPNDGTELTYIKHLEMHNERLVMQNIALHAKLNNMPPTPPNDGTDDAHDEEYIRLELDGYIEHLRTADNRLKLHNPTQSGVVIHDDVKSWLDNTNEEYGIPVGILVNAIIRHHMWLDVDTGEMRNDLSGMRWWPNGTEY